jgi:hypothetical protein
MRYIKSYKLFESSKYIQTAYEEAFDREYKDKHYSDNEFNEILNVLEKDCSQFLDELSSKKQYPIFRGASNMDDVTEGMWEKFARDDRFTRDSAGEFSEDFDDVFEKKYGVRLRSNGVFATKSPAVANSYDNSYYIFFPVDGYKYYHNNNAVDLYAIQPEYYDDTYEFSDRKEEVFIKINNIVDGYELNSIEKAGLCELTFICKKYYLIDVAFYKDICEYLGLTLHTKYKK